MEWHDTMEHECICGMYDFEPFYSPWDVNNKHLNHCYECNAYNNGKFKQAEISFKAGIKEVVDWIMGNYTGVDAEPQYPGDMGDYMGIEPMAWQAKLQAWGITP